MRNRKKKRKDDISEHVLVTHIACFMIFLMIAFIYFDLQVASTTNNIAEQPQPFTISTGAAGYPENRDAGHALVKVAEDDL